MKLIPLEEIGSKSQVEKSYGRPRRSVMRYRKESEEMSKSFSVLESVNREQVQNAYLQIQKTFEEVYQLEMRLATFDGSLGYYQGQISSIFNAQEKEFNLIYVGDDISESQ